MFLICSSLRIVLAQTIDFISIAWTEIIISLKYFIWKTSYSTTDDPVSAIPLFNIVTLIYENESFEILLLNSCLLHSTQLFKVIKEDLWGNLISTVEESEMKRCEDVKRTDVIVDNKKTCRTLVSKIPISNILWLQIQQYRSCCLFSSGQIETIFWHYTIWEVKTQK